MKNLRLILVTVAAVLSAHCAAGQWPVRLWDDDMPRHTFSLGIGPVWIPGSNPVLDISDLADRDITPMGFEITLRYDWSYFRGYEVSVGTGATYIMGYGSLVPDAGVTLRNVRVRELFNYIGANIVDTKMWFGKRTIFDLCIHAGYAGAVSRLKADDVNSKTRENGVMAGVSAGMDILITAWLGVGMHIDAMTGTMFPSGSSGSREYSRASVRVGAVYCF